MKYLVVVCEEVSRGGSIQICGEEETATIRWVRLSVVGGFKLHRRWQDDRHFRREQAILASRSNLYEAARLKNPNRWSRNIRNWEPVETVYLNPESTVATNLLKAA